MNLYDKLLNDLDTLPMHMPGHKRNPELVSGEMLRDITEIDGFDDLHDPRGVIRDLEKRIADLYSSDNAMLSVGGSTDLLIASVMASTERNGGILIASNCHISIWHAVELEGLIPVTVDPEIIKEGRMAGRIDPGDIDRLLSDHPAVKAVVITSPTYEGIISDTKEIMETAHKHGAVLITDAAHGAHLGIAPGIFPDGPYGDLVIKSIHKTLHAPTQTAVILLNGRKALSLERLIRHYLSILESSSPSYILMSGADKCICDIQKDKSLLQDWYDALCDVRAVLQHKLKKLSLFPSDDPSKIVIMTNGHLSGRKLHIILKKEYNIEVEASFPEYIIAMTGTGDTNESLERLCSALIEIDGNIPAGQDGTVPFLLSLPLKRNGGRSLKMSIEEAVVAGGTSGEAMDPDKASGKIAAEFIFAYPPGIPVIIPGQEVTEETAADLIRMLDLEECGLKLRVDPLREFDGKIKVVDIKGNIKV